MASPLPPFTPPSAASAETLTRVVEIRHPAYPVGTPPLLMLDNVGGGGLDFDLALTACCIVSNTPWDDGYLAQRSEAGDQALGRVDRPEDGLLRGDKYLFCVQGHDPFSYKYPVLPSFQHWRFPHGDLPPVWNRLQLPGFVPPADQKGAAAASIRDITCRVSGCADAVEKTHLVPSSESLWFVSNGMYRYARLTQSPIHDDRNIVLLRKDIHHLFDTRRLTFVPKRFNAGAAETTQLVSHALLPGSSQLHGLYHNRMPQEIRGVAVEFLFARFAWALFTDENIPFLKSGLDYAVRLWDVAKGESSIQTLRGLDIGSMAQIFPLSRSHSRSVNPKKRSLSTQGHRDDSCVDCCRLGDSSGDESDDEEDWPPRGRPLKRRCESLGDVYSTSSAIIL